MHPKNIIRILLTVILAALSCGSITLTPEEHQELTVARRNWHGDIDDHYNKKALQNFLLKSIRETKEIGGLKLDGFFPGRRFIHRDDFFCLVSGSWLFVSKDPKGSSFELRAIAGSSGWVVFVCTRQGPKTFKVDKTYVDPVIPVNSQPYMLTP